MPERKEKIKTNRFYRCLFICAFIPFILIIIFGYPGHFATNNFDYDLYQENAMTDLKLTYNLLTNNDQENTVHSPISIRYLLTMYTIFLNEYKNEIDFQNENWSQSYFFDLFHRTKKCGIQTFNTVFTNAIGNREFQNYIKKYFATEINPFLSDIKGMFLLHIFNKMNLEDSLKTFSHSNYSLGHFFGNNKKSLKEFVNNNNNNNTKPNSLFKYKKFKNFTAIEIEFEKNNDLSIVIIKPRHGKTLIELENSLRNVSIHEISFELRPEPVCVSLPLINISSIYNPYSHFKEVS